MDETIRFTAEGQQLYTRNLPSDESRAVFQLVDGFDTQGTSISTIIDASCPACSGAKISSLRIDAGRGVHGWTPDGGAVIEAGSHATVTGIEILEPRGNAAIRISGRFICLAFIQPGLILAQCRQVLLPRRDRRRGLGGMDGSICGAGDSAHQLYS